MQSIPLVIHYFWFGEKNKPTLVKKCIKSWHTHLSKFTIIEWNESTYNVQKSAFTQKAYAEKRWAFLSDYARLNVLYEHGGIYLDTDMEILKPLNPLLKHKLFLGFESTSYVNASIIGCVKHHWLIKECLAEYENMEEYETIPKVISKVLRRYFSLDQAKVDQGGVMIYPAEYFYPLPFNQRFDKSMITENSFSIHWWNYSWASPTTKILKRIGLLQLAIRIKKYIS